MTTVAWQPAHHAPDQRPAASTKQDPAERPRGKPDDSVFLWTTQLLPARQRRAMRALHAFWRAIESVTDDDPTPARRTQRLADWRYEISLLFDGRPQHPVTRALAGPARYCGLRRDDFLAVIEGKTVDCGTDVQAPSLVELDVHCAQVAVAVGLIAVRILGIATPIGDRAAAELGRAMRLTAILNELAADAARRRLYLPRDLLRANGIFETDPLAVLADPALPQVCTVVARRAERHFADAAALMASLPRRQVRAAAVMLACHRALLGKVTARGWRRLGPPVRVPGWRQAAIALRYGLLGR